MSEARTTAVNRPAWVDLSSSDAGASRAFYSTLLGWSIEVSDDPQYGGYGIARVGGADAAGVGPKMSPEAPTAWSLYIGTDDADELAKKVEAAGGTVIMAPFEVPGQGRMAVFQDPSGAFVSAWQASGMSGFASGGMGSFAWAELNARGVEKAIPFYEEVFGWTHRTSDMGENMPPYTEFLHDGDSILGGMEMSPAVPAEVPSHWLVYFSVEDVDASHRTAVDAGATELLGPHDFPGGRFAILADPEGAAFGLLRANPRE
jgi:predicted enzyme related to lactoylglutathione lyase